MNKELLIVGNLAKDIIDGKEFFGGSAASIAVNYARLGGKPSILSVLGKDDFSLRYRHFLEREGVDISLTQSLLQSIPVCEVISGVNNNSSYRWTDNDCHPTMDEMQLDSKKIQDFQIIHLISCPTGLAKRIANIDVKLSYEPGPMVCTYPDYFDLKVLDKSSLVFFNREEFKESLKILDFSSLNDFKRGILPKVVVVTKEEQGSDVFRISYDSLYYKECEALKVSKVIDHTGAGDAYKSGFLAGYVHGLSLDECGNLGSIMGGMCVAQSGGMVSRADVEAIALKYLK